MPVLLSDESWLRLQKMLEDYESGVLRVIPGKGLLYGEQHTAKANCPGTKLIVNPNDLLGGTLSTLNINVCINGVSTPHTFVIKA